MTAEDLQKLIGNDKDTWFNLSELAAKSGMQESEVAKVVNNSNYFVRSSSLSSNGESLFTTKVEFQKSEPLSRRLFGAFKNRID